MSLSIKDLENMPPGEEKHFWTVFESVLAKDDGQAVKTHLEAGRPVYYCDDRFPDDMIRKWSDGRKERVSIDAAGKIFMVQPL